MVLSWIVIHFRITDVKNRKSSKQILTGWHDCIDYQNEENVFVYETEWLYIHVPMNVQWLIIKIIVMWLYIVKYKHVFKKICLVKCKV